MSSGDPNVERLQGTLDLIIRRALAEQAERWRRLAGLVDALLLEN